MFFGNHLVSTIEDLHYCLCFNKQYWGCAIYCPIENKVGQKLIQ